MTGLAYTDRHSRNTMLNLAAFGPLHEPEHTNLRSLHRPWCWLLPWGDGLAPRAMTYLDPALSWFMQHEFLVRVPT